MAGMGRLTESFQIRLTPEEASMVRKAAASEGQSISEYIRSCLVAVRGIEGDPVAWAIIRKNIQAAIAEVFPPARRKQRA